MHKIDSGIYILVVVPNGNLYILIVIISYKMGISAFSLPELYEQEIEAVIDAGYYSNKSEVVRDALRTLFEEKNQLRLAAAIEIYKKGEATLSRAAEIAEMGFFQFKEILKDRGVKIESPGGSKKELDEGVELIRRLRKKKNGSP